MLSFSLVCTLGLLAAAAPAPFDQVLLKDGRIIEGKILPSQEGFIMLQLPGADIPIRSDLVDKTFIEDMQDYVPKSKTEEKQLAKGNVLFEGRWMSKRRRDQALQERKQQQKELIGQLQEEQNWRNRKKVETRHFIIESNCTQAVVDHAAELFETYYDNFIDFWGIKRSASEQKEKMRFFFYRSMENFHFVTNTGGGLGGFFSPLDKELHLPYDQQNPQEAWDVLLHEGNHMLTFLIDPAYRYPIWMNEGMAEYYGTARPDEKDRFVLGGLQYSRIVSLRNDETTGNVIGLRDLMLTPQGPFTARHYAAAWSFVHFLMESEQYSKAFRTFFKTLPQNKDVDIDNRTVRGDVGTWAFPRFPTVITALEAALGKNLEELEAEWRSYTEQTYGELTPQAYYLAARIARRSPAEDDDEDTHIKLAMEFFQKAVDMGIEEAGCYREYAEMLRKGGIDEGRRYMAIVQPPDPVRAWEVIQKAIEYDPINALNYTEAAGALIMDSPIQDLDLATSMVETARALARPGDFQVRSLTNELMALIEPAKERRHEQAELARKMLENDLREWMVQPFYLETEETPERIDGLSTEELKEFIADGSVDGKDWIFQSYRMADPETGELMEGVEAWEKDWVQLKDIPEFADDLAAASETAEAEG